MARARRRFPNVVLGYPFNPPFPREEFEAIFRQLPFNVDWVNAKPDPVHLLDTLKTAITRADYSL